MSNNPSTFLTVLQRFRTTSLALVRLAGDGIGPTRNLDLLGFAFDGGRVACSVLRDSCIGLKGGVRTAGLTAQNAKNEKKDSFFRFN